MAYTLRLAESRDLDAFARAERVLGHHFFNFGLLEFGAVLEKNSRRRSTGKKERQNETRKSATARSS
jgi:hypothetical protein